jgi:DNA-binding NtrC family response regulator
MSLRPRTVVLLRRPAATKTGPLVADPAAAAVRSDVIHSAAPAAALTEIAVADELVRLLANVLDIREVFPRVSAIASQALPHDRLTMTFHDGAAGTYELHAASNAEGPTAVRATALDPSKFATGSFTIVDDLRIARIDVIHDPIDYREQVCAAGYRSVLAVRLAARDQEFGLQFWSKQLRAFEPQQVPIARRMAEYVALAVSHQQLADAVSRAAEAQARAERLEAQVRNLSEELDSRTGYGHVVGRSDSWRAVLTVATQVAATETTVLLTGESGTGKEVVARYIHRASKRAAGPFVAVNCAALPEHLLESELFGYERGAFTGAQQMKPGQIERAAGGVLFLDEIGEMSSPAQAKLLRVLQEREFQRLGGTRSIKTNVRVIAATNRDLRRALERGDFRDDLYYRLQVFEIDLPALRERPEDILLLADAFLRDIGQSFGRPPAGMTREAKQALLTYRWPGNVRELRNVLERAAIVCEGGLIAPEHLALHAGVRSAGRTTNLRALERQTIEQVLGDCAGNKAKAARRLGLTRKELYGRLRLHELTSTRPR